MGVSFYGGDMETLIVILLAVVVWVYLVHWTEGTRWHLPAILLPLWFPFACLAIVVVFENF